MHKAGHPDRIWLSVPRFNKWAATAGLETLIDKARFCGIDPGHFHRIYSGASPVGGIVMSRMLRAPWPGPKRPEFEDFFDVGEVVAA